MKKKIVYIIILLVAIMLQTSFLPVVSNAFILGDAVLMLVLAWSVLDGFSAFMGWAVVTGILYDLATYSPVGEHVLIFLVVVYMVSFFSKRLSLDLKGTGLILLFIFVIVATFFSEIIIAFFAVRDMQTFGEYWRKFGGPGSVALKIVYNKILFFIFFLALKKIKKFFKIEA